VATGAFNYALEDAGLFIIYSIANARIQPQVLEKNMDSVVNALETGLVSEHEIQKV
jgi:hypothetical protein